jgi:hypothetical protein
MYLEQQARNSKTEAKMYIVIITETKKIIGKP